MAPNDLLLLHSFNVIGLIVKTIPEFPALMSSCTINWMDQWPDDALNFVALRFLGDTDFR